MGSPSRNVQYHPPRLSEDRLNLPQPHSPSLPTHCSGKSGMRPRRASAATPSWARLRSGAGRAARPRPRPRRVPRIRRRRARGKRSRTLPATAPARLFSSVSLSLFQGPAATRDRAFFSGFVSTCFLTRGLLRRGGFEASEMLLISSIPRRIRIAIQILRRTRCRATNQGPPERARCFSPEAFSGPSPALLF